MTVKGIDISRFQKVTDWHKVAASGIKFVYIRVLDTDGIHVDPYFDLHWIQAKAVGLLRGAYVPFYGWNRQSEVAQAVFDALDPLDRGDWWMGELPIAVDVEPSSVYKSTEYQWFQLTTLLSLIEKQCLVRPIIYTGQPTWDYFVNPDRNITFERLPDLWHAAYVWAMPHVTTFEANWNDDYKPFRLPNMWADYKIWQWAGDDGRVDGIDNACDLDVFNGTYEELVAWGKAHKISETDSVPDVELPFDSREIDEGVHELDIFGRFAAWWAERFAPKTMAITNQMVFNAFFKVYGGDSYWAELVKKVGQYEATRMAANRDGVFVELEKLPRAVSNALKL